MSGTDTQSPQLPPQQLRLTSRVYEHIRDTIGTKHAEQGGILGGNRETGEVTAYFFDDTGERSGVSYSPNNQLLNAVIKKWADENIEYIGSVHTHPPYITSLSAGDEAYAKRIIRKLDLRYLLTPIAMSIPDTGEFTIHPYAVVREDDGTRIIKQELVIDGKVMPPTKQTIIKAQRAILPIPWDVVFIGGLGLVTVSIATARLVRTMRYEPDR
jgi:hypothetical protein